MQNVLRIHIVLQVIAKILRNHRINYFVNNMNLFLYKMLLKNIYKILEI